MFANDCVQMETWPQTKRQTCRTKGSDLIAFIYEALKGCTRWVIFCQLDKTNFNWHKHIEAKTVERNAIMMTSVSSLLRDQVQCKQDDGSWEIGTNENRSKKLV